MKKLNFMLGFLLLFSIILVSSSFTKPFFDNKKVAPLNQGVGNIITIDRGETWFWLADNCNAPLVLSTYSMVQYSSSGFFHATLEFQLPAGHCDIPQSGARVTHYDEYSWSIVTPNGKVRAKIIYNPNGN